MNRTVSTQTDGITYLSLYKADILFIDFLVCQLFRGDMPLWGAVVGFLNHTVHFSKLSYYHWSHKTLMNNAAKSGRFRNDIPVMLVYADHNSSHPTINARVTSNH